MTPAAQERFAGAAPRRLVACAAALVLGLSLCRFVYDGVFRALVGPQHDFAVYYAAGKAVRLGENPYEPAVLRRVLNRPEIAQHGLAYGLYPPFLAVCVEPLSFLSFDAAAAVWFALNHLWIVLCVALAPLAFREFPRAGVWVVAAWLMMNLWPVAFTLDVGNANLLVLAVLMAGFIAHAGARPWAAGAWIAAAAMLKLHPIVFAPYALRTRRYKLLVAILLGCGIITAASLAAAGPAAQRSWLRGLAAFAGVGSAERSDVLPADDSIVHPANQSIAAFWDRLLTRNEHTQAWADRPRLARWLNAASCLALWLVGLAACRAGGDADARRLEFGLWVAFAVVASPQSWEHHYALLFIPYCAAAFHLARADRGWPWLAALAASYALVAMEYEYHYSAFSHGPFIPIMSIKLCAGVLLFGLLCARLFAARAPGRPAEAG